MQNNILTKLFSRQGKKNIDQELGMSLERQGIYPGGLYGGYKGNDYENAYPSINKLANAFMMIEPFTIDGNGKPVSSNILDRFYFPNKQMSAADWREALAVFTSVHAKVYIRVHHRTTRLTAETITGFTILEGVYEYTDKGQIVYQLTDGTKLSDAEVIILKGVNPYGLSRGFSPIEAARKWINIDDYIAAYQSGFFRNGAVPAGQFIINAPTAKDYQDTVSALKAKHQGADKNNNVVYTYNQIDPNNGKASGGDIQWIPFNTSNKDLGLKDLFDQANKKIDSAFGVPASIRGVNDNNTYASVRIDEVIFMKYVIDPLAMKIYSKFTHELNRITGGTGVALTYKIILPQVADEEKIKAEAKAAELRIITDAMLAGYSLDSIVTAFDLSNAYKLLKTSGAPKIVNDKPAVLTQDELKDTPDQKQQAIGELTVGGSKGANPKATKKLDETDRSAYEVQMADVVKAQLERQVEAVITKLDDTKGIKAVGDSTEEDDKQFSEEMMVVIASVLIAYGAVETQAGRQMLLSAGLSDAQVQQFYISTTQDAAYRKYLQTLAKSFNEQTAERIRSTLAIGAEDGLSRNEVTKALRNIISGGEADYRATRLAVTEVNTAGSKAGLFSMQNIQEDTGYEINKVWVHRGGDTPCGFCQALIGTRVNVTADFLAQGAEVIAADGGVFLNTWRNIDCGDLHANGHCGEVFEVVK